jgi:hypothetical protein
MHEYESIYIDFNFQKINAIENILKGKIIQQQGSQIKNYNKRNSC